MDGVRQLCDGSFPPSLVLYSAWNIVQHRCASVVTCSSTRSTGAFCVANAHLFWDPSYEELKISQARALVRAAGKHSFFPSKNITSSSPLPPARDWTAKYLRVVTDQHFLVIYMYTRVYFYISSFSILHVLRKNAP
jgi:hypothetical protein